MQFLSSSVAIDFCLLNGITGAQLAKAITSLGSRRSTGSTQYASREASSLPFFETNSRAHLVTDTVHGVRRQAKRDAALDSVA